MLFRPLLSKHVCTVRDFMEVHINISLSINLVKKSASPLYCAPLVNVSCWFLAKVHCLRCMGHLCSLVWSVVFDRVHWETMVWYYAKIWLWQIFKDNIPIILNFCLHNSFKIENVARFEITLSSNAFFWVIGNQGVTSIHIKLILK